MDVAGASSPSPSPGPRAIVTLSGTKAGGGKCWLARVKTEALASAEFSDIASNPADFIEFLRPFREERRAREYRVPAGLYIAMEDKSSWRHPQQEYRLVKVSCRGGECEAKGVVEIVVRDRTNRTFYRIVNDDYVEYKELEEVYLALWEAGVKQGIYVATLLEWARRHLQELDPAAAASKAAGSQAEPEELPEEIELSDSSEAAVEAPEAKEPRGEAEQGAEEAEAAGEQPEQPAQLTREDVEEAARRWLEGRGLMRVYAVFFTLPTEYLAAKTEVTEEGASIVEKKRMDAVVASLLRRLRKQFYQQLNTVAFKVYDVWVVLPGEEAKVAALEETYNSMLEVARKVKPDIERKIRVVELYIPRAVVVEELARNIEEVKLRIGELRAVIEASREARKRLYELRQLEQRLARLEEALRKVAGARG